MTVDIGAAVGAMIAFAKESGSNLILLAGLLAVLSGRLVPKPFVDDIKKDRDEWKSLARGTTQVAADSTKTQARTADVAQEATAIASEILRLQATQAGRGTPP